MTAYAEANVKWLHLANRCIVDEDYATTLRPPNFFPSSSESDSEKTSNDHLVNYSSQSDKLFSELESQWIEIDKNKPWWHTADLASFVSYKSLEYVDNCDLPLPQRNKTGRLVCENGPLPCGLDVPFSTTQSDEIKNSETGNSHLSNAELLEALCHSQRRAREAESSAQKAKNEKDRIVTLFLKQASQIFAYKQWLYILQIETLCLQLRHRKYQPRFSDCSKVPKRVHKRCNMQKFVGKFIWGLALVGAGVLLGWTVGWFCNLGD